MKSKSIVKILKLALKIPPSQDVFIPKCLPQIYLHYDGVALLGLALHHENRDKLGELEQVLRDLMYAQMDEIE